MILILVLGGEIDWSLAQQYRACQTVDILNLLRARNITSINKIRFQFGYGNVLRIFKNYINPSTYAITIPLFDLIDPKILYFS